ncbi:hypothetical protein FisN_15Hh190 [Fistulifera solaris]|uniref:Protein kinase domain-containing protein n=1 Tax=Fistulifera solaris TaxID=1519565 RepID=A0A1Z5JG25_FISSO|nr:hypothetical protein FisN_15Hh190 [Fistulifera solaris]|eukprot:GAX12711.1 hypothetical protein FisN_15Hh190 [Fistulifera solaris]
MPGRTASRRKVPVQNGGILAALSSNSLRTPPRTLIVSKRCDSTSSDDDDDVSNMKSPHHDDSSSGGSSSEQESSCEETDDEPAMEDEEEDDDSSCNSAIKEDSSTSFNSVEDDDLEIDQSASLDEGNVSENSTDEIESDHDEESDFDPDDTLSDDEELDVDEESSIENKPERNKESKKSIFGGAHKKSSFTNVTEVQLCEKDECSMSDDETVSVVAEIVEDSDTEQSFLHSDNNEESLGTPANAELYVSVPSETMDQTSIQMIEQRGAEQNEEQKIGDDHGSHDCDDVPICNTDDDCERVGEDPTIHFSVKSSSNPHCQESPKAISAEQHKVREIAFLSDRSSDQYRADANGLLSSDLSISPIKSCFTPERPCLVIKADRRSSTNERSHRANEKSYQNEVSGVKDLSKTSLKPNLFSPIVARSDMVEKKNETESDSVGVSTQTPCKKAPKDNENPSILRSINRAIRSLLRPDKAASKTNIRKGEWVLGSKLGSGAFGVVHVGMNTATGSLIAVKSIRMENVPMEDVRREIELLKSLDHPNIVVYHGAEMDAKYLHIFQEWVPGGSLCSMLAKFGSFRRPVLKSYLFQVLKGLAYLHQQHVMHRDLKGSNVLVSDAGVVKLADFGSSKRFDGSEGNMMLSLTMRGSKFN